VSAGYGPGAVYAVREGSAGKAQRTVTGVQASVTDLQAMADIVMKHRAKHRSLTWALHVNKSQAQPPVIDWSRARPCVVIQRPTPAVSFSRQAEF